VKKLQVGWKYLQIGFKKLHVGWKNYKLNEKNLQVGWKKLQVGWTKLHLTHEPILRPLNLQLQRQRCNRLERLFLWEENVFVFIAHWQLVRIVLWVA
jgi:hypothetical protein